ncbi:hypothetical protein K439DRAFT_875090 [Ramaria rubella]|nr:hypothetical protein K439DRAFT_875090 [Ramaria rubella]
MPIDLASDISKISETNVWAPELSETRSIVLDIVTTAQKSKRSNKERLQKFAHSVANHFVNFTKCTSRRNRSRAQTRFKQNVEEYEQVLRDASNVVNKYSVQSRDRSVQTATARETEIKNLEQRLIELQRSIDFLLLQDGAKAISSSPITRNAAGIYEIGVSIGRPSTVVNSRHTIGMSIERPQTTFPPHRLENNSNAGRGLSVFGSGKGILYY